MVLSGLSHVSIQVSDMDRSLRFYVDFLGLSVAIDRVETSRTELADGGSMHINRRAVYLRWDDAPGAGFVVLGQKLGAAPPDGDAGGLFGRGIDHVGLWGDDVDAFVARAPEHGAEILYGPAVYGADYYGEVAPAEVKTVMFLDPDGTVIQIDQWMGDAPALLAVEARSADIAQRTGGRLDPDHPWWTRSYAVER